MGLLKGTEPKTESKRKPAKASTLTISDGWKFGIGFFLAGLIAIPVIVGSGACAVLVILQAIGQSVGG